MNKQITFPILSNFCQDKQNINWLVSYWWSLSDITYLSENKKIIKDDNMIPILKSLIMLVCWFKSYDTPFLVCFVDAIKKKSPKVSVIFQPFQWKKIPTTEILIKVGDFFAEWLTGEISCRAKQKKLSKPYIFIICRKPNMYFVYQKHHVQKKTSSIKQENVAVVGWQLFWISSTFGVMI